MSWRDEDMHDDWEGLSMVAFDSLVRSPIGAEKRRGDGDGDGVGAPRSRARGRGGLAARHGRIALTLTENS